MTVGLRKHLVGAIAMLRDALPRIGDVQVRNRGTIGGSLAHADPAAELELGPAEGILLAQDLDLRSDQLEEKLKGVGGHRCT